MKSANKFVCEIFLLCCAIFLLASCAEQKTEVTPLDGADAKKLSCLIVMPTETPVDTNTRITSNEAKALQAGALFIDGVIADELKDFSGARLLNATMIEGLTTGVTSSNMDLITKIGKELKCDAVLTVNVARFHQREGGEFAADSPASASFTMRLIRISDGAVLWGSSFDETQESLLSNVLSFGKAQTRGFKWITVEELVRQGIHERLASCPYTK